MELAFAKICWKKLELTFGEAIFIGFVTGNQKHLRFWSVNFRKDKLGKNRDNLCGSYFYRVCNEWL